MSLINCERARALDRSLFFPFACTPASMLLPMANRTFLSAARTGKIYTYIHRSIVGWGPYIFGV
jgi:hypothetical protein